METPHIVTISGADGSGKTTIVRAQLNWISTIVGLVTSTTTRAPKPNDITIGPHAEYEHYTETEFALFEGQGRFLWTVEHADARYGTRKEVITHALAQREKIYLAILTPQCVPILKENAPPGSIFSIYIASWFYRDLLAARLRSRGDDEAAIKRRLAASEEWDGWAFAHYALFDQFITNELPDNGTHAAEYVRSIIVSLHKKLTSPR